MAERPATDKKEKHEAPRNIEEFLKRLKSQYSSDDLKLIEKSYYFSEKAHEGQLRRSGEPYISHPLSVASILSSLHLDAATIITGLLHDTVEDTEVTLKDIKNEFGSDVAHLVDGVTKISQISFRNTHAKQGENVRKMIIAMGKDIRVIVVKLADRLHNMRTLSHMPYEKQSRIAQETLDIYAPLANRLGISEWKTELEDLSFRYSKPDHFYDLAQRVTKKKKEREKYIEEVTSLLATEIQKRSKIRPKIYGRPKHLYSIYKKMVYKGLDYNEVYDILGFRIITNSVAQCYEVLGIVHSLYRPIPGRFKDYIAMAKANNYQSLHTTIIGPGGERIEIQIRTKEMHLVAERGIAAHWAYKEGSGPNKVDQKTMIQFEWLKNLMDWNREVRDSDEFLENVKSDLFESEIYVFTPKGDVKELREGATPLDFAYSIHTDVGNRTVGAKIDGRIVPLKYKLKSGDTIDIMTSPHQKPSKDWLKYCVTSRAQSKIRAFIRAEERTRSIQLGREILEKEFRKYGYKLDKYLDTEVAIKYREAIGAKEIDELFAQVAYGKQVAYKVLERLIPDHKEEVEEEESDTFLGRVFKSAKKKRSTSLVTVDGMTDLLVHYAKCCNPIPGDPIVGFISRGRGVTIHQASCPKTFEIDPGRRVDVTWTSEQNKTERVTKVRIICHDIPGLLKNMSEAFTQTGVNILNAQIRTNKDKKSVCIFDVVVRDTSQLVMVLQNLEKIKGVIRAERIHFS